MVNLIEAMICWKPASGRAIVVKHPDQEQVSHGYSMSVGACFMDWGSRTPDSRKLQLLIDAWHAVVFDGVSAEAMHEALCVIPEYVEMLADDVRPDND